MTGVAGRLLGVVVFAVGAAPALAALAVTITAPEDGSPCFVDKEVTFSCGCEDCPTEPGREPTATWHFGDDSQANGFTVKHTYTASSATPLTVRVDPYCPVLEQTVFDTIQVYAIGGGPSPKEGGPGPHYHGTGPSDYDHEQEYEAPEGLPDGTTCEWNVTNHLEIVTTASERCWVRGASPSIAVDDSEVKVRYSYGGKTSDWYLVKEWSRMPQCTVEQWPDNPVPPPPENPVGWETWYAVDIVAQLKQGDEWIDLTCHWAESFSDEQSDCGGDNWELGPPGAELDTGGTFDLYSVVDTLPPSFTPQPVGPEHPDAGTKVDHVTQKYWGGGAFGGHEEGVLMKSHTVQRYRGYGRQIDE